MFKVKKNSFISLRRALMIVVIVAATFGWDAQTQAQAGNSDPWTVAEVEGAAMVAHDGGAWQALRKGDVLKPGSKVKTGKEGRVLLKRPGDSLAVSSNSKFGIPGGGEARPFGRIVQSLGTLLFKVKTRPQDPFRVKTPYLAAVIKGTTFTVSVNSSTTALHVTKGAVQVNSILTGQSVLVRPGETAIINPRNGGSMRLVGRSGGKQHSKVGKSRKKIVVAGVASSAATAKMGKKAAARLPKMAGMSSMSFGSGSESGSSGKSVSNSGRKRTLITRRLGERKVSFANLTKGLVGDAAGKKSRKRSKNGKSRMSGGGAGQSGTSLTSAGATVGALGSVSSVTSVSSVSTVTSVSSVSSPTSSGPSLSDDGSKKNRKKNRNKGKK